MRTKQIRNLKELQEEQRKVRSEIREVEKNFEGEIVALRNNMQTGIAQLFSWSNIISSVVASGIKMFATAKQDTNESETVRFIKHLIEQFKIKAAYLVHKFF
ncbi:MAG: hypothetical protein KDD36_10120 [Flavobacteriales bacterium]|nr:hypothetical protein [Flavobacteriales bacterium]